METATTETTTVAQNDKQLNAQLKASLAANRNRAKTTPADREKKGLPPIVKKAAAAKKVAKTVKVAPKKTAAPAKTEATGNELNLKQLCNQLSKQLKVDIDPRMARRKLRKAKISGHDFRDRWTFVPGTKAYEAAVDALTPQEVKDSPAFG